MLFFLVIFIDIKNNAIKMRMTKRYSFIQFIQTLTCLSKRKRNEELKMKSMAILILKKII